MQNYEKTLKNYYQKLSTESSSEQVTTLKSLYKFILTSFESSVIDNKRFAYDIAGTMQFEVALYNIFKPITTLAGELELPDNKISGDINKKYSELMILIRSL